RGGIPVATRIPASERTSQKLEERLTPRRHGRRCPGRTAEAGGAEDRGGGAGSAGRRHESNALPFDDARSGDEALVDALEDSVGDAVRYGEVIGANSEPHVFVALASWR